MRRGSIVGVSSAELSSLAGYSGAGAREHPTSMSSDFTAGFAHTPLDREEVTQEMLEYIEAEEWVFSTPCLEHKHYLPELVLCFLKTAVQGLKLPKPEQPEKQTGKRSRSTVAEQDAEAGDVDTMNIPEKLKVVFVEAQGESTGGLDVDHTMVVEGRKLAEASTFFKRTIAAGIGSGAPSQKKKRRSRSSKQAPAEEADCELVVRIELKQLGISYASMLLMLKFILSDQLPAFTGGDVSPGRKATFVNLSTYFELLEAARRLKLEQSLFERFLETSVLRIQSMFLELRPTDRAQRVASPAAGQPASASSGRWPSTAVSTYLTHVLTSKGSDPRVVVLALFCWCNVVFGVRHADRTIRTVSAILGGLKDTARTRRAAAQPAPKKSASKQDEDGDEIMEEQQNGSEQEEEEEEDEEEEELGGMETLLELLERFQTTWTERVKMHNEAMKKLQVAGDAGDETKLARFYPLPLSPETEAIALAYVQMRMKDPTDFFVHTSPSLESPLLKADQMMRAQMAAFFNLTPDESFALLDGVRRAGRRAGLKSLDICSISHLLVCMVEVIFYVLCESCGVESDVLEAVKGFGGPSSLLSAAEVHQRFFCLSGASSMDSSLPEGFSTPGSDNRTELKAVPPSTGVLAPQPAGNSPQAAQASLEAVFASQLRARELTQAQAKVEKPTDILAQAQALVKAKFAAQAAQATQSQAAKAAAPAEAAEASATPPAGTAGCAVKPSPVPKKSGELDDGFRVPDVPEKARGATSGSAATAKKAPATEPAPAAAPAAPAAAKEAAAPAPAAAAAPTTSAAAVTASGPAAAAVGAPAAKAKAVKVAPMPKAELMSTQATQQQQLRLQQQLLQIQHIQRLKELQRMRKQDAGGASAETNKQRAGGRSYSIQLGTSGERQRKGALEAQKLQHRLQYLERVQELHRSQSINRLQRIKQQQLQLRQRRARQAAVLSAGVPYRNEEGLRLVTLREMFEHVDDVSSAVFLAQIQSWQQSHNSAFSRELMAKIISSVFHDMVNAEQTDITKEAIKYVHTMVEALIVEVLEKANSLCCSENRNKSNPQLVVTYYHLQFVLHAVGSGKFSHSLMQAMLNWTDEAPHMSALFYLQQPSQLNLREHLNQMASAACNR